jgi:endoglucanase
VKGFLALACALAALTVVGGGLAADSGPLPARVEHDAYYTWPGAQLLQVTPVPWGAGFVQNAPKYYIDCPLACIRPFDTGATVTLTATPSAGYTFVGWQVADHGQSPTAGVCPGTGTCTVTMSGAKDVVALFDGPTPQPVGVIPQPPGARKSRRPTRR